MIPIAKWPGERQRVSQQPTTFSASGTHTRKGLGCNSLSTSPISVPCPWHGSRKISDLVTQPSNKGRVERNPPFCFNPKTILGQITLGCFSKAGCGDEFSRPFLLIWPGGTEDTTDSSLFLWPPRRWMLFFLQLRLRNLKGGLPGLTSPSALSWMPSESAEGGSTSGQPTYLGWTPSLLPQCAAEQP